jgi:hypothetical protein
MTGLGERTFSNISQNFAPDIVANFISRWLDGKAQGFEEFIHALGKKGKG